MIVTEAVRLPGAIGVKVTLMEQLAPAATELPHVLLDNEKSPVFVPVTATLEIFSVAVPVLLRVTGCAALGVPKV